MSELTRLLSRLVAIDSVNPSLVPGGAGEAEAAAFVAGWGRTAGLDVSVVGEPARPSVVLRARGSGGGRSLLLCGHLDTVGVEGMADPHLPRVDGDWLYGRGSYDMKAGLAAALVAARDAAHLGLAGDVVVAAVADEEDASRGVQDVLGTVRADAAIVTEPTELEVVVAHKGFVWSEVEVTGRAAHGSRPALGVDAILKAGPLLVALGELDVALGGRTHPLLGRGSVHASRIDGGRELSSYPDRCVLAVERRTLPGESTADVERELDDLLARCRAADPDFDVERRTLLGRDALETDPAHEIVLTVRAAAAAVSGDAPVLGGASYWADSGLIAAAGIPTVLYGPIGEGAHAVEERVSLRSTEVVARTLVEAAARFCR
ncbi:MAG TPA: M20/M25/M40 family metallo-hydrolase [Gaiellaceae bacterium]|nr:M20/M25/M40 family metallo-hydrolase [Gaiellaceae bacterium]